MSRARNGISRKRRNDLEEKATQTRREKLKLELRWTPTKNGRKGEAGKAQQRESRVLQGGEVGSRVTVPPPKTL